MKTINNIPNFISEYSGFFELTQAHLRDPEYFQREDLKNNQKLRFAKNYENRIICPISREELKPREELKKASTCYVADCACRTVFSGGAIFNWIKKHATCPSCKNLIIQKINLSSLESSNEENDKIQAIVSASLFYLSLLGARRFLGRKVFMLGTASIGGFFGTGALSMLAISYILFANNEHTDSRHPLVSAAILGAVGTAILTLPAIAVITATEAPFMLFNAIGNYL